jgi:HTH-type transcriptional regulator / antitoxin HipB
MVIRRPVRTRHDLAAVVRGRRLELGLTQAAVAARIGLSRKWVSDVETGRTSPETGAVLRLFDGLGLVLQAVPDEDPTESGGLDLDDVLRRYGGR